MIENLLIDNDETASENLALHQLSAMFRENGNSCGALHLPEPTGDHPKSKNFGKIKMNHKTMNKCKW